MHIHVSDQFISITPYLSARWSDVSSLHIRPSATGPLLVVSLKQGAVIELGPLPTEALHQIFTCHHQFLIHSSRQAPADHGAVAHALLQSFSHLLPHFTSGEARELDSSTLPAELLEKLAQLTQMPVESSSENSADPKEEPVSDEDLTFRSWEIHQKGEYLYEVSHPLDPTESYSVHLNTPVGCTCGQAHCEHIRAVLHS